MFEKYEWAVAGPFLLDDRLCGEEICGRRGKKALSQSEKKIGFFTVKWTLCVKSKLKRSSVQVRIQ